jgi:hypothetical protein
MAGVVEHCYKTAAGTGRRACQQAHQETNEHSARASGHRGVARGGGLDAACPYSADLELGHLADRVEGTNGEQVCRLITPPMERHEHRVLADVRADLDFKDGGPSAALQQDA